jgi:hypothetical protein
MSANLQELEREVEQARNRVIDDMTKVSHPSVLSEFKRAMLSRAAQTKDDLVHQTGDAAATATQRLMADIKSRAAANPAAALAIGAGLAWRLARHPPVSTILVGLGVVGLARPTPGSPPSPAVTGATNLVNAAAEAGSAASDQARAWTSRAGRAADETLHQVSAAASAGASAARDVAVQASRSATEAANQGRAAAAEVKRDDVLLGAAALAIGAAALIGYRRYED